MLCQNIKAIGEETFVPTIEKIRVMNYFTIITVIFEDKHTAGII